MKRFCLLVFLLVASVRVSNAQVAGICSNPDIEAQILRCMRAGDICYLDGIIKNVGPKDISWYFGGGISYGTVLYDDMGNQYCVKSAKIGNVESGVGKFPSQIPIKIRLEVIGVSSIATEFMRFDWKIDLDGEKQSFIRFEGIPISTGRAAAVKSSGSSAASSGETTIIEDVEGVVNSVNELVNLFKKKK